MLNISLFLKSALIKRKGNKEIAEIKPGDLVVCRSCDEIREMSNDEELRYNPGYSNDMSNECDGVVFEVRHVERLPGRRPEDYHVSFENGRYTWIAKWLKIVV